MTISLEIKSILSPDLVGEALPPEADNCAVLIEAEIGEKGKEGAEIFSFTAITPKYLALHPETRWGRGYLLVEEFSWEKIKNMLARLLQHVRKESWSEAAVELSKELHWEFENYQK